MAFSEWDHNFCHVIFFSSQNISKYFQKVLGLTDAVRSYLFTANTSKSLVENPCSPMRALFKWASRRLGCTSCQLVRLMNLCEAGELEMNSWCQSKHHPVWNCGISEKGLKDEAQGRDNPELPYFGRRAQTSPTLSITLSVPTAPSVTYAEVLYAHSWHDLVLIKKT